MLTFRRAAVAAAVLGGLLAMGADPPLPVRPLNQAELAAKLLPTPRLFEITMVVDGKTDGPVLVCQSAETVLRQVDSVRGAAAGGTSTTTSVIAPARPGGATPSAGTGCKHTYERRADGAAHFEMTCDKAAGARRTYRSTADMIGEMQDVRHHMEVTDDGPPPHTRVIDTHTVMKGECPADLKPGEMRRPDGTKVDAARP